jgi:hypothetical protein
VVVGAVDIVPGLESVRVGLAALLGVTYSSPSLGVVVHGGLSKEGDGGMCQDDGSGMLLRCQDRQKRWKQLATRKCSKMKLKTVCRSLRSRVNDRRPSRSRACLGFRVTLSTLFVDIAGNLECLRLQETRAQ